MFVGADVGVTVGNAVSVEGAVTSAVAVGGGVVIAAKAVGEDLSVSLGPPTCPPMSNPHSIIIRRVATITTAFFLLWNVSSKEEDFTIVTVLVRPAFWPDPGFQCPRL